MAAKRNEAITKIFFAAFMTISIGLIFFIWMDGLVDHEPKASSYYRATVSVNEPMYTTLTAVAKNYELGTGTPEGKNGHGGGVGGGGGGGEDHEESTPAPAYTPTPKPTIDWDAVEQDQ